MSDRNTLRRPADGNDERGARRSNLSIEALETPSETDLESIVRLYRGEWWSRGRTIREARDALGAKGLLFVARDGDAIVAFARVLSDFVWKALVFDVIVAPAQRGEGLGRRLIEAIAAHPRLRGVEHLELYCLPDLEPFYRSFGFSADVGGVRLMRREARANA